MNIDMIFAIVDLYKTLLRRVPGSRTCQAAIDARGLSVEVPGRLTCHVATHME